MPVVPNRKPADHAQARVQSPLRELLPARNGDFHSDIHRLAEQLRRLAHSLPDHHARDGIDRGFAGRDGKAGARHGADARACAEGDAASGCPARDGRNDERAVRHVWIVARVLDDARTRPARAGFLQRQREARPHAVRKGDANRIGETAAKQRLASRARRSRRTGSRSPAAPQGRARICVRFGPRGFAAIALGII